MGWRFRKRIKLFPGVYLNISKSGLGLNIGVKGANVTLGPSGTYVNTGIPGTGLYQRDKIESPKRKKHIISPTQECSTTNSSYSDSNEEVNKFKLRYREPVKVASNYELKQADSVHTYDSESGNSLIPYDPKLDLENYHYPTLDLLSSYDMDGKPFVDKDEMDSNKERLIELLHSFGVELSFIRAIVGPRATLYEIGLAQGVNIKKLYGLEDDIAMRFYSSNVRIAPILGKGTLGIEIPNPRPFILSLESLLKERIFQESTMELPCILGKTITNEPFMFDLAKAPHILVAGSTGQGKSVCLNTILLSLLYKKHPAELKLVLMDPLGVEFGLYSGISNHFLSTLPSSEPIITSARGCIDTLDSLIIEMKVRLDLLEMAGVNNIKEYNKMFIARRLNPEIGHRYMPYIVVMIDSYSTLAIGNEERIAQLLTFLAEGARTVGIHLVIATNRPTSDIVSSRLKSYIPTRISFYLPESIDSQVILDSYGAEMLQGPGDLLFKQKKNDLVRIQGAFVSSSEITSVVNFISRQQSYDSSYELPDASEYDYGNGRVEYEDNTIYLDNLFEDVARYIVESQNGSISQIQRMFAIGYNYAGRLMDQMEKAGIVGPCCGSKPRKVLIQDEHALENLLNCLRG